jgi:mannosyltransferase
MPTVVHSHFHPRYTGATAHVEAVARELGGAFPVRVIGQAMDPSLPHTRFGEVLRLAAAEDVVWHAHRNNELMAALVARLLRPRLRVVYTRHGPNKPSALTRWLFRRADAIVALTAEGAKQLPSGTQVIGHGVSLARFRPGADREADWAARGLGGRYGVGVFGRIRKDKGQEDFARAVCPLIERFPEWRAVVVGRIQREDRFWAGRWLKAGKPPTHVPEQSDLAPWYRGASIVVQPSWKESFSLVLLEAMASGCCVVASRLPHFPELIEDGVTGFLYPRGDVEALRALLERLMAAPALAAEVGARAAQEAKRRFGVEVEARKLAQVYSSLWAERGVGGEARR